MSTETRQLKDEGTKLEAVIAGAISGLTARSLTAPLDVMKIHMQLRPGYNESALRQRQTLIRAFMTIYRQAGIKGFWRGNVSASWLYITYNTTQFSAYKIFSPTVECLGIPSPLSSTASGALAGMVATILAYPFDLVRTRFAAQGSIKVYANFRNSIWTIYASEGFKGFYRGLAIAVGQGAPYMGLLFGTYESFRPLFSAIGLPAGFDDALTGAVASAVAKTGTYPLDLIRKRIQIQGPSRHKFAGGFVPEYASGFVNVGKEVIKNEGWQGLYRGLTIGLVKATPTSTISMWSYGLAIRMLSGS